MTNSDLSRRSITKGAAWGVPALTVAAAAPALAASPVPSVRGASYFFDTFDERVSPKTIDGRIDTQGGCSYTVTNGPASVTNLSMTYWLPLSNYKFAPTQSTVWSTPVRDTSKPVKVGPTRGLTYYPYTTTYAGTGVTSTTCGPAYSFAAPAVTTTIDNPGGSYYYQFSYSLNGVAKTNPLQDVNNP